MKYIFFTWDGIGLPIAKKLQDEGNEVTVAQIQDVSELGFDDTEKPENRKKRLNLYNGVFKKLDAKTLIKALPKITDKEEYFVIFDFNNLWNYGEQVAKMGFNNIFYPTEEQFNLERDRKGGKDFVKKYYPTLEVAEVMEFQTIDEAVEALEDTDDVWALKSNSDKGETFVPTTDDVGFSTKLIIAKLNEQKADYEAEGFILERKIPDIKEFTPEIVFWNGVPIHSSIDIEYKHIGSGANGEQVGCGNNLIIKTELDCEANKMAFPPIIYEMAKKHKGLFIWDASILYCPSEDKYYFGEFCANRWGWDSFFSNLAMTGSVTDYFESLMKGQNPLQTNFGVSVRGFNHEAVEDSLMLWNKRAERNLWIYDCYTKGDEYKTTGMGKDLVVFTGAGDDIEDAVDEAYDTLENFAFNKIQFRPKFDFLTRDFSSSIINRYEIVNHNLIDMPDYQGATTLYPSFD